MTFLAYETSEAGSSPVELYKFGFGPVHSYYTSADSPFTYSGAVYVPYPMGRGKVAESEEARQSDLLIKTDKSFPPVKDFFPGSARPVQSITLQIFRVHLQDPDSEVQLFWDGIVFSKKEQGFRAELLCRPTLGMLEQQILRGTFQRKCNHNIYDEFCSLSKAANQFETTVIDKVGLTLNLTGLAGQFGNDELIGGVLENLNGIPVMIETNSGTQITVFNEIPDAEAGATIRVAPGCQQDPDRCKALGNYINYLGFKDTPNIELHNPDGIKGEV